MYSSIKVTAAVAAAIALHGCGDESSAAPAPIVSSNEGFMASKEVKDLTKDIMASKEVKDLTKTIATYSKKAQSMNKEDLQKQLKQIIKTKQVQEFANQLNTQAKSILSSDHIEDYHNQIFKVLAEHKGDVKKGENAAHQAIAELKAQFDSFHVADKIKNVKVEKELGQYKQEVAATASKLQQQLKNADLDKGIDSAIDTMQKELKTLGYSNKGMDNIFAQFGEGAHKLAKTLAPFQQQAAKFDVSSQLSLGLHQLEDSKLQSITAKEVASFASKSGGVAKQAETALNKVEKEIEKAMQKLNGQSQKDLLAMEKQYANLAVAQIKEVAAAAKK